MKKTLVITMFLTGVLAAGSLAAQTKRHPGKPLPCPHPVTYVILGAGLPPTQDLSDFPPGVQVAGSVWNQTVPNKAFGFTFSFPAPPRECCIMTSGTLVVTLKSLLGGRPPQPNSGNDGIAIYSATNPVFNQLAWPNGANPGDTTTLTFNIPPAVLATGHFSLYVQDDTAVVSANLSMQACCLQ